MTSPEPRTTLAARHDVGGLGAAEVLDSRPGHHGALAHLYGASIAIGDPAADATWPWPAPRLSYVNAAVAEAVIVSGHHLGGNRLLRNGLRMPEWLLTAETHDGHQTVVSPEVEPGRAPGHRMAAARA
jgi:hypothetical protein